MRVDDDRLKKGFVVNKSSYSLLAAASALLLSVSLVPPASAAEEAIPTATTPGFHTTLTIKYDDGTTTTTTSSATLTSTQNATDSPTDTTDDAAASSSASASTATADITPAATASPAQAGPQGARLSCNRLYTYQDGNNTYTIQHKCGGTTAPWGIKISPSLCATAVGSVNEVGMSWTLQGTSKPRQAGHVVSCGYGFHGTYNPVRDNNTVSYADTFTWRMKNANARLQVYGTFTATGNRCTSPTSC